MRLSGASESEYFQSYAKDSDTAWIAETERANQEQIPESTTINVIARALARFASDRNLPFPLPIEWHKRSITDPITGDSRRMTAGEQYLYIKAKLGMKDKSETEVRRFLAAWPKRWPSPQEAQAAVDQALGIEGTLILREKILDAKETAQTVIAAAKAVLAAFAPGVGAVVLDRISKMVKDGAKLTLDLVDDQKARAETQYARTRTAYEAKLQASAKEVQEKREKAAAEKAFSRWLVVGAGVAVGAAVTFYLWRGRKG